MSRKRKNREVLYKYKQKWWERRERGRGGGRMKEKERKEGRTTAREKVNERKIKSKSC